MDLVPFKEVLDAAIETRRAFPEGSEVFKRLLEIYVTDPLKERRDRKRVDRVAELAGEKIGDRERAENLEEVMTSTEVEPLLEAIQDDDRKELQEIWANMLAKFATGKSQGFRREFVSTLKRLEPIDVKCLEVLLNLSPERFVKKNILVDFVHMNTSINRYEILISLDSLIENKCLDVKKYQDPDNNTYVLSPYGKVLSQVAFSSV